MGVTTEKIEGAWMAATTVEITADDSGGLWAAATAGPAAAQRAARWEGMQDAGWVDHSACTMVGYLAVSKAAVKADSWVIQ